MIVLIWDSISSKEKRLMRWRLKEIFTSISQRAKDAQHYFKYLLPIYISFFENYSTARLLIPSDPSQNCYHQESIWQQMLMRLWGKWSPDTLLGNSNWLRHYVNQYGASSKHQE